MKNRRPEHGDCAPYFLRYINLVEGNDIVESFVHSFESTIDFLQSIPREKWDYAYDKGKWTIVKMMIHIIDAERIFAYRALRIARNDKTNLLGFNQDAFMTHIEASSRSVESVLDEYQSLRKSNISMYQNFTDEMWHRKSLVSNHSFSVLAIAFLSLGHEIHHFNVLKEKYL